MSFARRLLGSAAALLMGAAAGVAVSASPAHAASCPGSTGVTVIVQFNELGGGTAAGCAAAGPRAAGLFDSAGFPLTYTTNDASFVCRVSGRPASDDCVNAAPAHAYWSLWTADGDGGGWVYAQRGVTSLVVPDGGYLAFVWQGSAARKTPSVAATRRTAPVTPTTAPSDQPGSATGTKGGAAKNGKGGSKGGAAQGNGQAGGGKNPAVRPSPSSAASPSAPPSAVPSTVPSATPSQVPPTADPASSESASGVPTPSADGTTLPDASDITADPPQVDTSADDKAAEAGLPVWVPILVVIAVAGAGGVVVWRRRSA